MISFKETSVSVSSATVERHTRKSGIASLTPEIYPTSALTEIAQPPPIEVYTAYVYGEKIYFKKIIERLYEILKKQKYNVSCHAHEVTENFAWQQNNHLSTAKLIILLISPDFLRTDFCYTEQMCHAVERHHQSNNQCYVIPILVRPTLPRLLQGTPFSELAFLPARGKAVSQSKQFDQLFNDIAEHILAKLDTLKYYNN